MTPDIEHVEPADVLRVSKTALPIIASCDPEVERILGCDVHVAQGVQPEFPVAGKRNYVK